MIMTVVTIVLAVAWFGMIAVGFVRWLLAPDAICEWHLLSEEGRRRQRAHLARVNASAQARRADAVRAKAMADARAKMAAKR